jgi:hypothetical protein
MPLSRIGSNSITNASITTVDLANTLSISANTGSASAPAISPTGDNNTGIFFPAADTIAFSEGGSESARIDSSGSLRINNTGSGGTGPLGAGKFQMSSNNYTMFMGGQFVGGDVGSNYFAVGNWGDSSSELRLSSRGTIRFRLGATGEADGTLRAILSGTGAMTFGNDIFGGPYISGFDSISLTNGSTVQLVTSTSGSMIICIYDASAGDGGLFWTNYSSSAVTKLAGDGSATDAGSNFAVYKSGAGHSALLKNRYGSTRGFRVAVYAAVT